MKLFLGAVLFIQILNPLFAYEVDQVKKGDNLESIAKRNLEKVNIKYAGDLKRYEEDLKKWNADVTDWNGLKKNDQVYVDYPYASHVSGATWAPPLGRSKEYDEYDQYVSLSAFYASSFGNYKEATVDQEVTSGQNFPVTLGAFLSVTNEEKIHFLNTSVYWAQASKGEIKDNSDATETTKIDIPGEVGGNIYYQYYFKDQALGVYFGYDYEKLNTFNTSEILIGSSVENEKNDLHYVTLGASKNFSVLDLKMNLKTSASLIVSASTTGSEELSGYKYIVYYTVKPEGRFSFSAFFKHHELEGATDLLINRFGLSVGFSIF
jgi:hypothetical protein